MTRQLGLHLRHNAALRRHLNLPISTSPSFKAGRHLFKKQVFSDSIHNNTSVSKPYSLRLFTKLLLKWASTGHSAVVSLQKQELDPVYTSLVRDLKFRLLASCMFWIGHLQRCEKGICHPYLLVVQAQHCILLNAIPPELLTGSSGQRTRWGRRETSTITCSPPRYIT